MPIKLPSWFKVNLMAWLLVLGHHIAPKQSSMTRLNKQFFHHSESVFESQYLAEVVQYHKENPVFAKRKLTTLGIEGVARIFSLSIADAFVLYNFLLLLLHGVLIYKISETLFPHHRQNNIRNIGVYYFSFSILFMFFAPVYSYDEPLQYALILGALWCYFRNQILLCIALFSLATLARESSLMLLPAFLYHSWKTKPANTIKIISFAIIPLGIYFYYRVYYTTYPSLDTEISQRIVGLRNNFLNLPRCFESLFSFLNTAVLPALMVYLYWKKNGMTHYFKPIAESFFILLAINSVLVFLGMNARESRLFSLPFLLITPYLFSLWEEFVQLQFILPKRLLSRYSLLVLILILLAGLLSFGFHSHSFNLMNEYGFLALLVTFGLLLQRWKTNRTLTATNGSSAPGRAV